MSVFADMSQEMVLVQRLAELQERLKHAEMLNHQRWEDVLSLQRDLGNRNGTGEGTLLDLQLPAIYNFLPHLANGPDAIRPALKVSKGRTGATMVLGIPTVKREVQSYLMGTLHNLIANMNPNERETSLIVVLIAETDLEFVNKQAAEIQEELHEHTESGLLEIVAPPASYYPDMDRLRETLGDPLQRVKWRAKQTLDFAYLMMYAQSRGTFYVQLEDDILSKPGYISKMRKMFKCVDLSKFVAFFLIFYNDKPVDWLLDNMMITTVCRSDKDQKDCRKRIENVWIHYKPSLFQHVGMHSSLKGKVQKLKDHQFGKLAMFVAHQNPEARVSTTLKSYRTFTITRAYKGISYFWNNITFQFTPPVQIERQVPLWLPPNQGIPPTLARSPNSLATFPLPRPVRQTEIADGAAPVFAPPAETCERCGVQGIGSGVCMCNQSTTKGNEHLLQAGRLNETACRFDFVSDSSGYMPPGVQLWEASSIQEGARLATCRTLAKTASQRARPFFPRSFLFRSGNPEHPKDRFFNTTVEVRLDYEPLLLSAFPRTADGFYVVGSFKESNGVAERVLPADLGAVSILRLNVQSDSDHWAILSETNWYGPLAFLLFSQLS
ncbi:hypothetical protein HPB47_025481 [Ixodes persulcatus]|uniref:Uncharacterized protein n=1 Tax=Ixodes persulcatus TaxID=34615 RepID=A0AC60Q1R3_IXOPE|nr:hypothetical protein HPB47_025481 [Ixodes persulcatus]